MNKILKTFLFTAGIYLFFLTIVLMNQPRFGSSPNIEIILINGLFFAPLWALILGTYFYYKKHPNNKAIKRITKIKTHYFLLILLLFFGFIFNLDYLKQIGCFIEDESIYAPRKFILTGSSFILLTIGYLRSNRRLGIFILILEFLFWTIKSLYYNNSLNLIIPGYFTMICWTLRYTFIALCLKEYAIESKNIK